MIAKITTMVNVERYHGMSTGGPCYNGIPVFRWVLEFINQYNTNYGEYKLMTRNVNCFA